MASGWSRLSYSEAAWNASPDAIFAIIGVQANADINLGSGWSREEWGSGAWNESLGTFVTGQGNIFIEDGQSLTATANNITVTGNAPITINGEELILSQGEEITTGSAPVTITGEELLSATVNTFAVSADGAITINTPTFEANVELNNDGINVGLATFLDVTGFPLSANLNNVDLKLDSFLNITGNSVTSSINNISVTATASMNITGNQMTINLSNANVTTQQILSILGNQANVSSATLKFWDPITGNVTEIWTNIH